jgi:hypothetical protein
MSTTGTDQVEDFDVEDFEVENHYPFAPPQQWVILSEHVTGDQLAVYTFTMAHLNPLTGKFHANFGRRRVAERFGKSLDWVDKQFRGLIAAGAVTRRHMYWVDFNDRSATGPGRTTEPFDDAGHKRAQAPNRWRIRMIPQGGPTYPGPIRIAEFYDPSLIDQRVAAVGGAATQRPGSDQGKQESSQVNGGAATQRPGGAATQRPKRPRTGKTTNEEPKTTADAAAAGPLREPLPSEKPDHLESVVDLELELAMEPPTRARGERGAPVLSGDPKDYPEPTADDRATYRDRLDAVCGYCRAPAGRLCARSSTKRPFPAAGAPHDARPPNVAVSNGLAGDSGNVHNGLTHADVG